MGLEDVRLTATRTDTAQWFMATAKPTLELNGLVLAYWEIDGEFPPGRERELPRGDVSILVSLAGQHAVLHPHRPAPPVVFETAWVAGLQRSALISAFARRGWVCGVRLTIEGAFRVFGPGLKELTDRLVPLDEVIAGDGPARLVDAVRRARTPAERLSALDRFVRSRLVEGAALSDALGRILRVMRLEEGAIPIGRLAEDVGWSRQHLHARFVEHVGVSPRLLNRLQRFHAAIREIGFRGPVRLTDIAYRCGYYDQAHFAHDFRAFAGVTATEFLARRVNAVHYGWSSAT